MAACDKESFDVNDAFNNADVIFQGDIESLKYLDNPLNAKIEPRILVEFSVHKVWKGTINNKLLIHTTFNQYTCNGFNFKTDKEYLVYSQYNKRADNILIKYFSPGTPTLGVKIYGGTKLLTEAKEDIKFLKAKEE